MAVVEYPDTLPCPAEAPLVPAERRRLTDLPGALAAAYRQRDYLAEQRVVFPPMTPTKAAEWHDWYRSLETGGNWFQAFWPLPAGAVAGVRRWVEPPQWRKVSSFWQVTGTVQVRGIQGVTTQSPDLATGTFTADQLIANTGFGGGNHPHEVDVYVPDNVTIDKVICILHGGSGDKQYIARFCGITQSLPISADTVNWNLLKYWRCAVVIPRGQYCDGTTSVWNPAGADTTLGGTKPGVRTWSNYFMWSGANDPQFLTDLATWADTTWPGIKRCIWGHSNGGFMVQRLWYDVPNPWQRMGVISGPAAWHYDGATKTGTVRPMISIVGGKDAVLNTVDGPAGDGGHFYDNLWYQSPSNASVANVDTPGYGGYMGEFAQFQRRVDARNTQAGAPAQTVRTTPTQTKAINVGLQHTWVYAQGAMWLRLVEEAGHGIAGRRGDSDEAPTHQVCTGRRVFSDMAYFFDQI